MNLVALVVLIWVYPIFAEDPVCFESGECIEGVLQIVTNSDDYNDCLR